MPFGLQPWHILVVAIVALIIFGPSRLPELGRSLGKSITEFRKGMKEMTDGMREEMQTPDQTQAARPTQSTANYQPQYAPPQGNQPFQQPAPPQPVQTFQSAAPTQPAPQASEPQPSSAGVTCGNCGTINAPGARFCNQCGASLIN